MRVMYDQTKTPVVCHLVGNLEHLTVGLFREEVSTFRDSSRVIFELSAVPFIDSAGVGALIGAVRKLREGNGDAAVCSARPSVARVLKLVGLSRVVPVVSSVDEARACLQPAA